MTARNIGAVSCLHTQKKFLIISYNILYYICALFLNIFQTPHLSFPHNLVSFFPTKSSLCWSNILACVTSHWSLVGLRRSTHLEKMDHAHTSQLLPIAPQVRVEIGVGLFSPCCDLVCQDFHGSCACCQISCQYVQHPLCIQKTLFPCSHLASLTLIPFPYPIIMHDP